MAQASQTSPGQIPLIPDSLNLIPDSGFPSSCSEPDELASKQQSGYVFPLQKKGEVWELPAAMLQQFREDFPHLDVERHIREARSWCQTNPTKRKTPKGMPRFLSAWLTKAQNSGRGSPRGGNGSMPIRTQRNINAMQEFLEQGNAGK